MNILKASLYIISLLFLSHGNGIYAVSTPLGNVRLRSIVKLAGATGVCVVAGKLVYDYGMLSIEDKFIDEVLDMLTLECTPNFQLKKLPAKEYEAALRKKARFINIRKRALSRVYAKAKECSPEHQKNIQRYMRSFNAVFAVVDMVRRENMYEHEYEKASYVDYYLENMFVSSVLLNTKPTHECTKAELQQRAISLEIKVKIAEKIKARGDKFILKNLVAIL